MKPLSKARIEAFGDGFVAMLITVMVINVLASIIGYCSVYPALILFAIVPVLYIRSRNH